MRTRLPLSALLSLVILQVLLAAPAVAHFRCGNGALDIGEACDDGSEGGEDGCGLWSVTQVTTTTIESEVGIPNTRAGHVMVVPPHGRPIVFRRFAAGFIAQVCDDAACTNWTTRTLDSGFGTTDTFLGYPAGGLLPDGRPVVVFQRGWAKNAHSLYTCADQLCVSGTLTPLPIVPLHSEPAHWELLAPPVPADLGGIHLLIPVRTRGHGGKPTTLSLFICYDDTCTTQNNTLMVVSSGLGFTELYDVFPTVQYDAAAGKFVVAFCRLENSWWGVWTLTLDPFTLAVSSPTKVVGSTGIQQCLSLRSTVDPVSGRMVIASGRLDGAKASGPSYVVAKSSVEVHTCANDGCTSVVTRANVIPASYGGSMMPLGVHYDDENNLVVEVGVAPFGNSGLQVARCNASFCRLVRVKTEGQLRPLATAQRSTTGQIVAVASRAQIPGELDILMIEEQAECFEQPRFRCIASAASPPASICTPDCECATSGQTCDAPGLSCAPVCGDGLLAGSETCDSQGPECETPSFSSIAFTDTNSSLPSVTKTTKFTNADPTPFPLLPYWNANDIAGYVRVAFDNRWFTYTCDDAACSSASEQIAAPVYRVQSAPKVVLYRNGVDPVVFFTGLPLNLSDPQVGSVVAFDVRAQTFSSVYSAPVSKSLSFSAVVTSTGFVVFYSHSGETAVRSLACSDWTCTNKTTSTLFQNVPAAGVLRAMSIGAVQRGDGTAFVCADRPVGASFVLNRGIRCFSCANEQCTSSLSSTWFETLEVITSSFNIELSTQGYPLVLFVHREVMTLMKCENFHCTSAAFAPVDPRLQWLPVQRPVSSAVARTGELMVLLERAESARNEWWVGVSADYSTFAFRKVAADKSLGSLLAPKSSFSASSTPLMMFWRSPYCFMSPISCGPSGPSSIEVYQCASQDCLACQRPVPPSLSPTPAATATGSGTQTPVPSATPTALPTAAATASPTAAATASVIPSPTVVATASVTASPSPTLSTTNTPQTSTVSGSISISPSPSRTSSPTSTISRSSTLTVTPIPTLGCAPAPQDNFCLISEVGTVVSSSESYQCNRTNAGRKNNGNNDQGIEDENDLSLLSAPCEKELRRDGDFCAEELGALVCTARCRLCGDSSPAISICKSQCASIRKACPRMDQKGCFNGTSSTLRLDLWCTQSDQMATECRTRIDSSNAAASRASLAVLIAAIIVLLA